MMKNFYFENLRIVWLNEPIIMRENSNLLTFKIQFISMIPISYQNIFVFDIH